jgi:hypothetical protein
MTDPARGISRATFLQRARQQDGGGALLAKCTSPFYPVAKVESRTRAASAQFAREEESRNNVLAITLRLCEERTSYWQAARYDLS